MKHRYWLKCFKAFFILLPHWRQLELSYDENKFVITLDDRRISIHLHPWHIRGPVRYPYIRVLRVTVFASGPSAWGGMKRKDTSWQHLGGGWGNAEVQTAARWLASITLAYE